MAPTVGSPDDNKSAVQTLCLSGHYHPNPRRHHDRRIQNLIGRLSPCRHYAKIPVPLALMLLGFYSNTTKRQGALAANDYGSNGLPWRNVLMW
jgi:hypothetical protein